MTTGLSNRLLKALTASDLEHLSTVITTVKSTQGTAVYESDSDVEAVWFPTSGLIGVQTVLLSGAAVQTSMVGSEGALGVLEVCGGGRTYSRAVVEVAGEFHRVPAKAWCELYEQSSALRALVQAYNQMLLVESRQLLACQARHTGPARLAWLLLSLQDRLRGSRILPITQDALADMMGAQRTSVTAWAVGLRHKDAIEYRRGRIEVTDRQALEKAACECHATNREIRREIENAAISLKVPA